MAPEPVRATAPSAGIVPTRPGVSAPTPSGMLRTGEAAKTVFAGSGVDAPAKEITDLAGVGVGTLYRHFPRRSDLIVAVCNTRSTSVSKLRKSSATLSPWEALMGWIERYTTSSAPTRARLGAALRRPGLR